MGGVVKLLVCVFSPSPLYLIFSRCNRAAEGGRRQKEGGMGGWHSKRIPKSNTKRKERKERREVSHLPEFPAVGSKQQMDSVILDVASGGGGGGGSSSSSGAGAGDPNTGTLRPCVCVCVYTCPCSCRNNVASGATTAEIGINHLADRCAAVC